MRLICHVTSRDNVIRGSCEIIVVFSSSQAPSLPGFMAVGLVEEETFCFQLVM